MKFIGYHGGHDANITIINEEGKIEFYAQAERYQPRIKTYGLNLEPIINVFPDIIIEPEDVMVLTSLHEEAIPTADYDDRLIRRNKSGPWKYKNLQFYPTYVIDHHLAHAISAWCFRNNDDEKLFISIDGAGATTNNKLPLKASLVGLISNNGFSILDDALQIHSSTAICQILGSNTAGKAMGLAGFFDPPVMPCNPENLMKILHHSVNWRKDATPCFVNFENPNIEDMKFIGSFYKFLIDQIWEKVHINVEKFSKGRGVVISGGSSLALELNTKIFELTKDVTFGPATNDTGLSIGAASFAYYHVNRRWPKINTASLNAIQKALPFVGPQDPYDIANLIHKNKVIGLLRGKAEAGPRALGFRSLFASAMDYKNLKKVSEDIKGREFYRPLAPIVTSEAFDKYFIGPKGEYMQYRCLCTETAQECLPAIVHKDKSARPQVVYKEQDPWLHSLLVNYGKLSGHECFINTSLNGKGKPICNIFEDAVEDFKNKDVKIISIGTKPTPKFI